MVTVIPEARDTSSPLTSDPRGRKDRDVLTGSDHSIPPNPPLKDEQERTEDTSVSVSAKEPLNFPSDTDPTISQPVFPPNPNNPAMDGSENNENTEDAAQLLKAGTSYPPFPCPFCDRAYTSWGFRRRHIKAVHTVSPMLNCKWCLQVLPNHGAWRRHVISCHNLSASDAHNGLLILEEAHMVLQIAHPTRLDTLVNIIKRNSQRNPDESAGIEGNNDEETRNREGND